jgi:Fur family transcriptional regulator, ferric uptake regulator
MDGALASHRDSHENLEDALKTLGYRLTPQRSMILAAAEARDDHFSAEEIHAEVVKRFPNVSLSTVYRTMELLAGLGLVTSTDLGDGCLKFHSAPKGHHHHMICQTCGHVFVLDESALKPLADKLLAEYGFRASLGHFAIFGQCSACSLAPEDKQWIMTKRNENRDV